MAIAFDAQSNGIQNTGGLTCTVSHTVTGTNCLLLVACFNDTTGGLPTVTGATYNGVAMTQALSVAAPRPSNDYLFYLINPAVGTHNIVVTRSAGTNTLEVAAASYTGVSQTGFPDAQTSGTARGSTSLTTVANNTWIVAAITDAVTGGGTNLTVRNSGQAQMQILDSNGALTPAGSKSLSWAQSGSGGEGDMIVSLAPVAALPKGNFLAFFT
jgi:hypothetical protein